MDFYQQERSAEFQSHVTYIGYTCPFCLTQAQRMVDTKAPHQNSHLIPWGGARVLYIIVQEDLIITIGYDLWGLYIF